MQNNSTTKRENLTGQKFNRLTAIKYTGRNRHGNSLWLWRCECGTEKILPAGKVKGNKTKSCGCLYKEDIGNRRRTHGRSKTLLYGVWCNMIKRCVDNDSDDYKNYGGRGITVCDRWRHSFENFLADMGERPSPKHTIERKNNNGNYEPENCVWATRLIQNHNTRWNRNITFQNETMCMSQWARRLNIDPASLHGRLEKWPLEKALTTPKMKNQFG